MDTGKVILVVGAVAVAGGVIFVWTQYNEDQKNSKAKLPAPPAPPAAAATLPEPAPSVAPPTVGDSFPLKVGSQGKNVMRLQNAVNRFYGAYVLPVTGVYDGQTVVYVQKAFGRPEMVYESSVAFLETHKSSKPAATVVAEVKKEKGTFNIGNFSTWGSLF